MLPTRPCAGSLAVEPSQARITSASSLSLPARAPKEALGCPSSRRAFAQKHVLAVRPPRQRAVVINSAGFGVPYAYNPSQPQLASMSRILIGVQPLKTAFRSLARNAKPSGPISVLLVLLALISAAFAAIRARIVSNVRSCTACHGYGISRCSLCKGTGAVGWEGKWSHKEPCPLCVGKRFVECTSCGGHYHRPMFNHIHRTAMDVEDELEGLTEPTKVISGVLED